jgi:transcriptional regulator with XRE-family HTH domain
MIEHTMAKNTRHPSPLRRIRLQHGLTQSQLAEIAGVEPKTVQRWESGANSPRLFSIQRLCAHFNAVPADLGFLDMDQQHEESQETHASIRHHSKDKASPDRQPCCCLCWLLARSVRQIRPLRIPSHDSRILLIPLKERRIEMHSPVHLQKG